MSNLVAQKVTIGKVLLWGSNETKNTRLMLVIDNQRDHVSCVILYDDFGLSAGTVLEQSIYIEKIVGYESFWSILI